MRGDPERLRVGLQKEHNYRDEEVPILKKGVGGESAFTAAFAIGIYTYGVGFWPSTKLVLDSSTY